MYDLEYNGVIYVRPVGRGVSLVELDWQDLDEATENAVTARHGTASGWTGRARITVEIGDEARNEGDQDDLASSN
jgi:hypothetical protein